jgi:hypothetical protein
MIDPKNLMGAHEAAAMFGVTRQRFYRVMEIHRRRFPKPVVELMCGPIWNRDDLDEFLAGWNRRPGRPKKIAAE